MAKTTGGSDSFVALDFATYARFLALPFLLGEKVVLFALDSINVNWVHNTIIYFCEHRNPF
jgi:hypothetical protein